MSLADRINNDLKDAMKAKDQERLDTLRLVRAEILKKEKEKVGTKIDDETMLAMLNTMVKQRRDSIEQFEAGGRAELAEKEKRELALISQYLPAALSEAEIAAIVDETIKLVGATHAGDIGRVMGPLMKKLKETGKSFDGKAVNGLAKARLG